MAISSVGSARTDLLELRRLLAVMALSVFGFGVSCIVASVVLADPPSVGMGFVLMSGGLILAVTRVALARLNVATAVMVVVAIILAQAVAVAWLQPVFWLTAIVPLLAVGVALPYVSGRLLALVMGLAWLAILAITIAIETSSQATNLPNQFRHVYAVAGLSSIVGVFLLQLTLYSRRLNRAFGDATRAEHERQQSEKRYSILVERLTGVLYESTFGPAMRTTYVSPQIHDLLGYTPEEWLAGPGLWASTTHPEDRKHLLANEQDALRESGTATWEYRMTRRDGAEIWVRDDETVVTRDENGVPVTVQGFMLDITDQKSLEAQLSHQAFHDSLTGLPNRAMFFGQVDTAIARARRAGTGLAVVYVDLDDFKVVNDTLGHIAGDRLLVEVGRRLRSVLRAGDTAARVGGDEFNVLLEGLDDEIVASDVVRRLLDALSEPYRLEGMDIRITATAGISTLGDSIETAEELQRQADAALYEGKLDGKAGMAWYDASMSERAWARLEIEHGLQRAIENDELVVAYQPVFDLRTSRITGVEALIRWQHPVRGLVAPDAFIPVAERSGLIVPLGRFVLGEACHAGVRIGLRNRQSPGGHGPVGPMPVSVNVSALQILDEDFVTDVSAALASSGLPAACLTLELTESAMILEGERTDSVVAALRSLGVRLAIDDFGTGYSSLSYARRFPVDELKVDRTFVAGLAANTADGAILAAAVAFARALDLDVTAEGVETIEQLARLRAMGCDRIQGFLLSPPVFEAELLTLLETDLPAALVADPSPVQLTAAS
jgi:diguanylate cyclase (GGDEF)-like protein/PAS domain S-box-containing protein